MSFRQLTRSLASWQVEAEGYGTFQGRHLFLVRIPHVVVVAIVCGAVEDGDVVRVYGQDRAGGLGHEGSLHDPGTGKDEGMERDGLLVLFIQSHARELETVFGRIKLPTDRYPHTMSGIIDFLGFLGPQILEEVLGRLVLEQKQGSMNQLRTHRSPKKGFVDFPGIMNDSILDQAVDLIGHSGDCLLYTSDAADE